MPERRVVIVTGGASAGGAGRRGGGCRLLRMEGVGADRYDRILDSARGKAPLAEAVAWLIEGGRTVTGTWVVIDAGIALGI